ncbi:hypothetical protein RUND412_005615 [Rhizina undulata]
MSRLLLPKTSTSLYSESGEESAQNPAVSGLPGEIPLPSFGGEASEVFDTPTFTATPATSAHEAEELPYNLPENVSSVILLQVLEFFKNKGNIAGTPENFAEHVNEFREANPWMGQTPAQKIEIIMRHCWRIVERYNLMGNRSTTSTHLQLRSALHPSLSSEVTNPHASSSKDYTKGSSLGFTPSLDTMILSNFVSSGTANGNMGSESDEGRRYIAYKAQHLGNLLTTSLNAGDSDEELQQLITAMKDDSNIHDYPDTKPYKEHFKVMADADFEKLAKCVLRDMNYIHLTEDVVHGMNRAQRFQRILSLVRTCKGTIWIMARASSYEECILFPDMMENRFADNQKNNAKKKADNRELQERRADEYRAIHGCDPPPALKGRSKRPAQDASEAGSPETTKSAPATKRRKSSATLANKYSKPRRQTTITEVAVARKPGIIKQLTIPNNSQGEASTASNKQGTSFEFSYPSNIANDPGIIPAAATGDLSVTAMIPPVKSVNPFSKGGSNKSSLILPIMTPNADVISGDSTNPTSTAVVDPAILASDSQQGEQPDSSWPDARIDHNSIQNSNLVPDSTKPPKKKTPARTRARPAPRMTACSTGRMPLLAPKPADFQGAPEIQSAPSIPQSQHVQQLSEGPQVNMLNQLPPFARAQSVMFTHQFQSPNFNFQAPMIHHGVQGNPSNTQTQVEASQIQDSTNYADAIRNQVAAQMGNMDPFAHSQLPSLMQGLNMNNFQNLRFGDGAEGGAYSHPPQLPQVPAQFGFQQFAPAASMSDTDMMIPGYDWENADMSGLLGNDDFLFNDPSFVGNGPSIAENDNNISQTLREIDSIFDLPTETHGGPNDEAGANFGGPMNS